MNSTKTQTRNNTKALGLLLASVMAAGAAHADRGYVHGSRERGVDVSGTVVVTKEIPGGVITVGGTIGNRPVVVEEKKVVIVKQEERCEPKKVVIIKEAPRREVREVVVVREQPREKVVIIKERGRHGKIVEKRVVTRGGHGHHDRDWDRDDRRGWDRDDDRGYGRGHDRDFSHGKQVSIQQQGPDGNYHYYEDAHQVSIQDNRGGMNRHVYVQK
jgi:hypothetical protein